MTRMEENDAGMGHIHGIANAFKQSQILFTAHAAGLFDFLAKEKTESAIARAMGWSPRGTRFMLRALAAMHLVTARGARWRNAPAAAACLQSGAPNDQGAFLRHTRRGWDDWARLDACLRGGAAKRGRHRADSEAGRDYVRAMHAIALRNAPQCAALVDCSGKRRLLDLGCGMGAYAAAFLQAWPSLRVVLVDTRAVLAMAREYLAARGVADRCEFVAGDARRIALPADLDIIWISNVLHAWGPEECRACIARCFAALRPGGVLYIRDFLDDETPGAAAFHPVFGLDMMLHSESGGCYTAAEVAAWTRGAGFKQGRLLRAGRKSRIWTARKP